MDKWEEIEEWEKIDKWEKIRLMKGNGWMGENR
jgi:hypothetical protein